MNSVVRRVVAALAAVLVVYAMAGFFLAPWLVRREVLPAVSKALGRPLEAAGIEFNPFMLSARLTGVRLRDRDGSVLAGVDELFVNFQASSLFRRAWTFDEIRLAGPYAHVVRDRDGELNLAQLLPPGPPEPQPAAPSAPPRLIIGKFILTGGAVDFDDAVPQTPFHTRLGPLDVRLQDFTTLPDAAGRQSVTATLDSGITLAWSGTLGVNPLKSVGEFHLNGPVLPLLYRYLRDELNFGESGGDLKLDARYEFAGRPDGSVQAGIDDLALAGKAIHLRARGAGQDFLVLPEISLAGASVRWPESQVKATGLVISGLHVAMTRGHDGAIDIVGLLTPRQEPPAKGPAKGPAKEAAQTPAAAPPPAAGSAAPVWKVALGAFEIRHAGIDIRDESLRQPAALSIADLNVALRNVSNEPGARFDLDSSVGLGGGGTLGLKGTLGVLPDVSLDGELVADGIRLAQFQPYVGESVRLLLKGGELGLKSHIASTPAETLALQGDLRVTGLDLDDTRKNERLLAWRELALDDLQVALTGRSARISRVRLSQPYARLFVAKDQSTNFSDLTVAAAPAATPAPAAVPASPAVTAATAKPFAVRVGRIEVANGSADYTDLSLPLPFDAHIVRLHGRLTAIDTRSQAPALIGLEGQVGEYGLARINGQLRLNAPTDLADISLLFKNIAMSPFSPYSIKFAGYKIASGKINLDLRYKFEHGRMNGENKIVLDQLELGEKVPNPDAIDLPLGLAIALLKDSDGRIDIDLPITGSVDDPQFSVGRVIWKAFVNLLTRAVTSPFRLLGRLVGIDSEKFGQIEFAPGRADLLPPDLEVLHKIADALGRRPRLSMEVPAVVDPAADTLALQSAKVESLVTAALGGAGGRNLVQRTRRIVEDLYTKQFPDQPLRDLRERFTVPPPDQPAGKRELDELAYVDELRRQLTAAQVVAPAELDALGAARAAAVVAALSESPAAASRVRAGARKDVRAAEGAGVPAELALGQ